MKPKMFDPERIFYRLMNAEYAADHPEALTMPFHGMTITFHYYLGDREGGCASLIFTYGMAYMMEMDAESVLSAAHENTPVLFPLCCEPLHEMCMKAGDREKLPEEEDIERLLEREMPPAFVITNEQGLCGAAAVLYPGVLRSVAEYFEDDLYLIPSSIHEMILVPTRLKADREEVDRMIREVNAAVVSEEEVLNERCLCYRRSDGHFD
ncbi:MAG: hypothetical protein IJR36_09595 [Lachnospiraceae bacterium]|nr:hypothetical protein [Lachnospiraceae bacterium]MBQ9562027.1 hypothetical protein [Lachnospiraceae bacterium]MBQ9594114.1 hypothetical protein [Lachnospiraceae bacterium]MBR0153479.1 hypothetical protein [Lachnospiraceae bacterium]